MVSKKDNKDLVKILRNAGVSEGTSVNYVKRKREEILSYVPFSSYDNDAFGTDSSHEERAHILDKKGIRLCEVVGGYTSIHSDGSTSGRNGETVRTALKKLESREELAKYVLVEGIDGEEDNTIVVSKSKNHEFRGLVTKREKSLTLYEL